LSLPPTLRGKQWRTLLEGGGEEMNKRADRKNYGGQTVRGGRESLIDSPSRKHFMREQIFSSSP